MTPTLQHRAKEALETVNKMQPYRFGGTDPEDDSQPKHMMIALDVSLSTWATIRDALRLAADPDWIYVPREPTERMYSVGQTAIYCQDAKGMYTAMIAAAPVQGGV